ncbi:MAG: DUF3419 family protein [Parachlamydiales bacterium]
MPEFYSRLSYSFGNEDEAIERRALQVDSTSSVFCITASGDRPLHLLMDGPAKLVAVDANAAQNALYHLKAAAIRELDFGEYMAFIGASSHPNRLETFERIAPHLPDGTERYWRENREMVNAGVLWQGAVERMTKFWSPVWRLIGIPVERLFQCQTLEEQRTFLETKWKGGIWQKLFKWLLHPNLRKVALRDPGLYAFCDPNIEVGTYVYERMMATLKRCLARENAMVSLILTGRVGEAALPAYLTEQGVAQIREHLDKAETLTTDAMQFLEEVPKGTFDRFSFSDIASYLSQADFERMLEAMAHAAKPGARFCIRQCFSSHQIPPRIAHLFEREPELEAQLEQEDRSFFYRFMIGTVR